MIELIGWTGMVLIFLAVWDFSASRAYRGNWFNCFGTTCWVIMAMDAGLWPLLCLNGALFVRSAWMILEKKTCYDT